MQELFSRFALALGIGLLIGLERGWATRADAAGTRTAGIRTFALTGLLGGAVGGMSLRLGDVGAGLLLGLGFTTFGAVFAVFCREENRAEGTFSATTMVAGLTAFALGAYAVVGDTRLAAAAGVAAAGILALREGLHRWVERITQAELRAGLTLLAMTFIALPLLPDREIGPFGGVNPRNVWLIAIILAAVSFVGYAAVKVAGQKRGILIAAAAGGLVSSTAVMVANARRAAAGEGDSRLLAAGASLATAVALLRTLALIAALNTRLLALTLAPLLAGAVAKAGAAYLLAFRVVPESREEGAEPSFGFRNPFEVTSVGLFAVLLGGIVILSRFLSEQFGAAGAIAMAIVAGLADTDTIVVAMARLAPDGLTTTVAAVAVLSAVASNTVSKLGIGMLSGDGRFAAAIAASTLAALAAGTTGFVAATWLVPGLR